MTAVSSALVIGAIQPAVAQAIPSGGQSLVAVADIATNGEFYSNANGGAFVATRDIVPVTGQSFTQALRVEVQHPTGEFFSSAASAPSNRPVADGDIVLLHFFLRAIQTTYETGTVFCQAYVEGPGPNYTKSISQQVSAGLEWVEYFLPFAIEGAYASGELRVNFGFGAGDRAQILELAGAQAIWYGKTRTLAEMPRTSFQYDGRAANAPWRAEAAARIEQIRKGNYQVRVVDAHGDPVAGAAVHVRLRRHAFPFGTAFQAARVVNQSSATNQTYRAKLVELFNAGSTENDLKWPPWDGEWGGAFNRTQTLAALQWLHAQGFQLRGHVLVWPSTRNLPQSITQLGAANPAIPQRVLDHIADIVPATREYLGEWDVLNEPYDNHDLMDWFGDEVMLDWFDEARARHPTATLFINDYAILSGGGLNTAHQDHYENVIRYLVDNGAPLGGIGMQGHFEASPTGIPKVWSILERFADAFPDLGIKVTEFDIDTDDEQLQADYTRDFLTLLFSHPSVVGFQMWGFWEGAHWKPRAAMYRTNWEEKPNGAAFRELVHHVWQTDETQLAAADGRVTGRGFLGDYEVEVNVRGQRTYGTLELPAGGGQTTITVTPPPRARYFFGTFGGQQNSPFALMVRADNTCVFLGSLGASGPVIRARGFALAADGTFSFDAGATLGTISGRIDGATVAGAGHTTGSTFSGSEDAANGISAPLAGAYDGAIVNTADGVVHVIAGSGGHALIVAQHGDEVSAMVVPLAADGHLAAAGEFDLALVEAGTRLSGTLTAAGQARAVAGAWDQTPTTRELFAISMRAQSLLGDNIMIAGIVVSGPGTKRVLIRGIGPGLGSSLPGRMANPLLRFFRLRDDGRGWNGLGENDDWGNAANAQAIDDAAADIGLGRLGAGTRDAAALVDLSAGVYTAHVVGVGDTTGIALVEVYDVGQNAGGGADFIGISMRGMVGTGNDLMIPGFIVSGDAPKRVLVRGIGPDLPPEVSGRLVDPTLRLFRFENGSSTQIAFNDDWETGGDRDAVVAAATTVGLGQLNAGSKSAAIVIWLAPGVYTAHVAGANNTAGVALVELYGVP